MKKTFINYLDAYIHHDFTRIENSLNDDTVVEYSTFGKLKGFNQINKMPFPEGPFNILTNVVTNYVEEANTIYATVHHMHAIDKNNEFFPLVYGGKYQFIIEKEFIVSVKFDLEYEYGNTYLVCDKWKLMGNKTNKLISASFSNSKSIEDTIYKFFWAVDYVDSELASIYCTKDLHVERAGVNGETYVFHNVKDFIQFENNYFDQNQYSLHLINKTVVEDTAKITLWHLSNGKHGNKHLGSNTKYHQFYNEIIVIELVFNDCWQINNITITRKEQPIGYGYTTLEL